MTHHQLAVVSLSGSCFDVLGALYLAYDILGGKDGPLRALTRAVTYGIIFGFGYGVPLGLPFGIASGVTHGITFAMELTRASRGLPPYPWLVEVLFGALRGLGFALGASYIYGTKFGIVFGILSTIGQAVAYRIGSRPEGARNQPRGVPRLSRSQLIGLVARTAGYALAGYFSAAFAHHQMHAVMFGEEAGLTIGIVSGAATLATPYIEWTAENLPDRRLGVLGIVLILIGFTLQSVQYWVALLDIPVT